MKACENEFKSIISDRGYKEDDEASPLLDINHSELFLIMISTLKYILDKLDKSIYNIRVMKRFQRFNTDTNKWAVG
jgi:hypothetical protein